MNDIYQSKPNKKIDLNSDLTVFPSNYAQNISKEYQKKSNENEISKKNEILLQKILHITNRAHSAFEKRSNYENENYIKHKKQKQDSEKTKVNRTFTHFEKEEIKRENQRIIERIIFKKSSLRKENFLKDFQKHEEYKNNIKKILEKNNENDKRLKGIHQFLQKKNIITREQFPTIFKKRPPTADNKKENNEEIIKGKDFPIKNNETGKTPIASTKLKGNQHKSYSFSDSKSKQQKISEIERKEKRVENYGRFNLEITQANQTLENLLETCNKLLSKPSNISNIIDIKEVKDGQNEGKSNFNEIKKDDILSKEENDKAENEIKQQGNIYVGKEESINEELNAYITEKFEEKESSYKEEFDEYIDESEEKKELMIEEIIKRSIERKDSIEEDICSDSS